MSDIEIRINVEITPELLADIKQIAKSVLDYRVSGIPSHDELVAIENTFHEKLSPVVALAMIERISQLEAAECWLIIDGDGFTFSGPFATEPEAEQALSQMPSPWRVMKDLSVSPWKRSVE